jgi:hypothetical protein
VSVLTDTILYIVCARVCGRGGGGGYESISGLQGGCSSSSPLLSSSSCRRVDLRSMQQHVLVQVACTGLDMPGCRLVLPATHTQHPPLHF